MKVKELIAELAKVDGDAEVVVGYDATEPRTDFAPVGFVAPTAVQPMGVYQSPRIGAYLGAPGPSGGSVVAVF
jgi:hypothetical protein